MDERRSSARALGEHSGVYPCGCEIMQSKVHGSPDLLVGTPSTAESFRLDTPAAGGESSSSSHRVVQVNGGEDSRVQSSRGSSRPEVAPINSVFWADIMRLKDSLEQKNQGVHGLRWCVEREQCIHALSPMYLHTCIYVYIAHTYTHTPHAHTRNEWEKSHIYLLCSTCPSYEWSWPENSLSKTSRSRIVSPLCWCVR